MHVLNYGLLLLVIEVYHKCEVWTIAFLGKEGRILYEKFAELLEKTNKTPYQVSKDTGIGENTLSYWKNGRSQPKVDKLKILADYFGVSIEYFLED